MTRNILAVFVAVVCALSCVAKADAGLIFYGSGQFGVQFTSSSGVNISALNSTLGDPIVDGNGFGTQGFSILGDQSNLLIGDSLLANISLYGDAPPDTTVFAIGLGQMTFTNTSLLPGSVDFRTTWSMIASTPTTFGPADFGNVDILPFLTDINGNMLLNGGSGILLSSATPLGGGLFNLDGFEDFHFDLNPGQSMSIDVGIQGYGFGTAAAVPEPSSIMLLGSSTPLLFAYWFFSRRRTSPVRA